MLQMLQDTGSLESSVSFFTTPAPHASAYGANHPSQRRRSSISDAAAMWIKSQRSENDVKAEYDQKYNILSLGNKLAPLSLAIIGSLIPAVVATLNTEDYQRSLFRGEGVAADSVHDICTLLAMLMTFFVLLQVLTLDSLESNAAMIRQTKWLRDVFVPRYLGTTTCELHLDSLKNVKAAEQFYAFFESYTAYGCRFNVSAFEVLGVICIIAALAAAVSAYFELGPLVWNVTFIVMGTFVMALAAKVLHGVAKVHDGLHKDLVKALHYQKRQNTRQMREEKVGKERSEELVAVNERIDCLVEEILETRTQVKLLGLLPLTKENVVKVSAATFTTLFATALRTSVQM